MKIGIFNFPIEKVGGIETYNKYLADGLRALGYKVENCFISTNKKKLPDESMFDRVFGFEKEEWLEELSRFFDECAILIFSVPCPHLLKNYRDEKWKEVYNAIHPNKKVLAIIHDKYLPKYYPWFKEVAEKHNIKLVLPKSCFLQVLRHVKTMKKVIPLPYKIKKVEIDKTFSSKANILVDANNYKSVKNKNVVVEIADKIKSYCDIIFFGQHNTIEYFQLKKNKNFNFIKDLGWQPNEIVFDTLLKAKISTDFIFYKDLECFTEYIHLESANALAVPIGFLKACPEYKLKIVTVRNSTELLQSAKNIITNFQSYKNLLLENYNALARFDNIKIAQQIVDFACLPFIVSKNHNWW